MSLIEREAAINAIIEHPANIAPFTQKAINAIKNLPAADKWIPADASLPKDFETVLVWFEYFRYGDYNCPFQMYGLSKTIHGKWSGIVNDTTGWKDLKIIAWQPLPAPPSFDEVKV